MAVKGPHKIWVRPEIRGHVIDHSTGNAIAGAKVSFPNSTYGGGDTESLADGSYSMPAVSQLEWFSWPGDPHYTTWVEAKAIGYNSVTTETGHGTGDVYGGRAAPIRQIDFRLSSVGTGDAIETVVPRQ